MKELQPINQNVLLELEENHEEKTAAGLIIPDTAKEKPVTAKVVAISKLEEPDIAIGDIVVFKQYVGTEIDHEGKKYLIIQYSDLLAKLVETESI
jgi:chaperonin GroES